MPGSRTRSGLDSITDPVLYSRVVELFSQAVALPPEEQLSFLATQCADTPEMLRLLQNLLREDQSGSLVLPANELAVVTPILDTQLSPAKEDNLSGRTLAHYEILAPIAAGGMGVVYRANDTRLGRTAALKFLPPALLNDPASRERFLREARAIASIDHPNVCTVYEIQEADGRLFIAMADLHGTTLDDSLQGRPMPLSESLEIAVQTARGLQAAHARGIVHRDVKPSNLMLVPSQDLRVHVRILDFGIARWMHGTTLTEAGLTIGTALYMAPEQVSGSRVDGRADIWSLGVVLYQMLSGRLPFVGNSIRETLAGIAGPTPVDLGALGKELPGELILALRKSLCKDPDKRYQTIGEFTADLEKLQLHLRSRRPDSSIFHKRPITWAAAIVAALAVTGVGLFHLIPAKAPERADGPAVVPFTFDPGRQLSPAISPDGKEIAFSGEGKIGSNPLEIYVQLIGSTDALQLTKAPPGSEDRFPVWDSNGGRIAFLRAKASERFARILIVPALGGTEIDVGADGVLRGGKLAWSPNGRRLAFTALNHAGDQAIFEWSLEGHSIQQLSFPAHGQGDCCPQYDPSSDQLAFIRNEVEIVVARPYGKRERTLPVQVSWPGLAWSADGRSIFYSWFGKLSKVDLASAAISHPGTEPNATEINIRGNRMAFVRPDVKWSIWMLDLTSIDHQPRLAPTQKSHLMASTLNEDTPQLSPDGQQIAFASDRSSLGDIWIGGRDGSHLRRLTFLEAQSAGTPRWSPDSKWIAFDARKHSSKPAIWIVWAAGGDPRRLPGNAAGADVPSWSQDGRWIYFHSPSDDQIWKQPVAGGTPIQVTRQGGFEGFESADSKSVYYSKSDGTSGIWKADLPAGSEAPIPELARAAQFRHWALAPNGIYYVPNNEAFSPNAALRFFDFGTRKTSLVGAVGRLVTAGPGALAVSRDEKSLLCVQVDRDNRNIVLFDNFNQ